MVVVIVIVFGSVDSYDEYYFLYFEEMILGKVVDFIFMFDNWDIVKCYICVFLLQCYYQDWLFEFDFLQLYDLFFVLGKVGLFCNGLGVFNCDDMVVWFDEYEVDFKKWVVKWFFEQLI